MNLPEFSLKRPVTIVVVMLIFLTIGVISVLKLPLEMMPDTSFPGLMVMVPYSSSSPEEVERNITRPIEDILSTVNQLKSLSSTSSSSNSRLHLQFENGTNMDMASMEIRDKIDQVRDLLPDDIERITIRRWSTSDFPILNFTVSIPGDLDRQYYLAENVLQPELERISGVANIDIRGLDNKELQITIKPELLYGSTVNILDLITTIRNNNINISAGYIEDNKRLALRIPGELKRVEQIQELPINEQGLKIKDVASITYDYPPKERYNRLNGKDSLRFSIYRASNANVVEVCRRVKNSMEKIRITQPELAEMDLIYFRDQSKDILTSLKDLTLSGIFGGLLAVLVLLFFLRKFSSTLIIAVAIPMSVVFTFSFMYIARAVFNVPISINIISLSGLMMAVGMLVDNGVVVLENIFRLKQDKGYTPITAAVKGGSEVAMAVTASTLTTLVVFVSIGFVSNAGFGRFMKDFALTISLALVASLLVSLTFIPLAGSILLKEKAKEKARWLVFFTNKYEKLISLTLKNRVSKAITMGIALVILVLAVLMFTGIEQELMPRSEERQVNMQVYTPLNITLDEMKTLFDGYEKTIEQHKKDMAVEYYTTYFGITNKRQGRYRGEIELQLADKGPTITRIKEKLKELFPPKPGITFEYGERMGRGGHGSGMRVDITGLDFNRISELVPMVVEKLRSIEEVEDITTDLEGGDIQLLVKVDRKKAESSGVDSRRVAQTIMSSISDRPIGKFKTENKEIDIILKVEKSDGFSAEDLKNIQMRSADSRIPISAISDFSFRPGSTAISKENKKSKLTITLNTREGGMMKISNKIQQVMNSIQFPEGYSWSLGEHWRNFRESQSSSNLSLILALIFVYIIMASLFESFIHPFTIMLTVPLALFGVAVFFTMTSITFNSVSNLGVLILMGIVVNNGIILIDHIRQLRQKGMEKDAAIIQGGKDRLRPIIMTAITTIFGVLPLALPIMFPKFFPAAQGRAQMWAPISVAILGGLTTSTFFTLIILPTFYSLSDSLTSRFKKLTGFQ